MKTLSIICLFFLSGVSFGYNSDSTKVSQPLQSHVQLKKQKNFFIEGDWLLETKAELINGISYSPTLEFNLSRPNGFNFQVQTGALPIMTGLKVNKTQPAAGFSFSYKF
ncbi:MAG: hypothetical protein BM555_04655 [Crocinitomix sp. MedPE-SWsnd]|jgi:hypothetical protein|nr:MAG: hypothetical protein BM555_04655 [Crocinitomix sp. MedPE-SWsnd]